MPGPQGPSKEHVQVLLMVLGAEEGDILDEAARCHLVPQASSWCKSGGYLFISFPLHEKLSFTCEYDPVVCRSLNPSINSASQSLHHRASIEPFSKLFASAQESQNIHAQMMHNSMWACVISESSRGSSRCHQTSTKARDSTCLSLQTCDKVWSRHVETRNLSSPISSVFSVLHVAMLPGLS